MVSCFAHFGFSSFRRSLETQPFADFATNLTDPYYLHPNENSSIILVTLFLITKTIIDMILLNEGSANLYEQVEIYWWYSSSVWSSSWTMDPWICCDNMVLSWIQWSISEIIAKSIMGCDRAMGGLECLERRFTNMHIFIIVDLLQEIACYQQGKLDTTRPVPGILWALSQVWQKRP